MVEIKTLYIAKGYLRHVAESRPNGPYCFEKVHKLPNYQCRTHFDPTYLFLDNLDII